jgi:alpha-tubulin suppressor-like RCC1 family protein
VALAEGGNYTLALRNDGTVAGWGWDYRGDVTGSISGDPHFAEGLVRLQGQGQVLSNVAAIAAGRTHSLALKRDGTVIGWGHLGVPAGLSNVVAISAARAFRGPNLVLRNDGTVVQWATDVDAAVVPGLSNVTAIASGAYHWLAVRRDGHVVEWPGGTSAPAEIPGLSNVVAVAAGDERLSMALRRDGTVAAWGGLFLRATVPAGLSNVVAIAAGDGLCLAITTNAAALKMR